MFHSKEAGKARHSEAELAEVRRIYRWHIELLEDMQSPAMCRATAVSRIDAFRVTLGPAYVAAGSGTLDQIRGAFAGTHDFDLPALLDRMRWRADALAAIAFPTTQDSH